MRRQGRRWLDRRTQVEAAGPGSLGRVTVGPWLGHDLVIEVDPAEEPRRSRRRRRASPKPIEAFGFEVSLVDRRPAPAQTAAAMPGEPFAWLDDLTSLDEYRDPMRVEWFTPDPGGPRLDAHVPGR